MAAAKKLKYKYLWDESMIGLGLKGNDLLVYAVIASHSQNRQGIFYGSTAYLSMVTGASLRAVKDAIQRLTIAGLVEKKQIEQNGAIIKNALAISDRKTEACTGADSALATGADSALATGADSALATGADSALDTYLEYDNNKYILDVETSSKDACACARDFASELIVKYGCQKSDVVIWFENRKREKGRKGEMTDTAFKFFLEQVAKAGVSVAEAVHTIAGMGWYGFKAEYVERQRRMNGSAKVDVAQHNAAQFQRLAALGNSDNSFQI